QREGAVGRARAASWGAFTEIDPKAETVPLESERFVKSVSVIALGVRGQHQLVAALIAAQAKRELHHGFADAVALQRWHYQDVLDDRRRRAEVTQVVHHQQGKGADNFVPVLGDIERVVGIVGEALEQLSRRRKRKHITRVESRLRVKLQDFLQIRLGRGAYQKLCLLGIGRLRSPGRD